MPAVRRNLLRGGTPPAPWSIRVAELDVMRDVVAETLAEVSDSRDAAVTLDAKAEVIAQCDASIRLHEILLADAQNHGFFEAARFYVGTIQEYRKIRRTLL